MYLTPHHASSIPMGAARQAASTRAPSDSFEDDLMGSSPASSVSLFEAMSLYGTSPDTPFNNSAPRAIAAKPLPLIATAPGCDAASRPPPSAPSPPAPELSFLSLSLPTLLGCCEMLGHALEDRSDIACQQDPELLAELQAGSDVKLRDESQQPLFVVAPLDVLVTREPESGANKFHIIEINGTGISGVTNMADEAVEDIMRSFSELAAHLTQPDVLVLVASSGQETYPPVSRTLHEKMLYVEALRRGFLATGRNPHITNMTRLENRPDSMPASGPTLVLGYMKQFRSHFMMDAPSGRLMLLGRQVHAAINDRFVLNTVYQFEHRLDLKQLRGYNAGYTAGADKGVAYELYNRFFGDENLGGRFGCMAPVINFRRARTRTELISTLQSWLHCRPHPAVIKPQGTGCGHGIEFFFGRPSWSDTAAKVDRALHSVAANYNLQCSGLPYTVCEYLDTATVHPNSAATAAGGRHVAKAGHKFELRVVVYRAGNQLRAFPSIAKVAREAFDPTNPDNKKSLINNITTSAKETAQAGQEFLLPLCSPDTLQLLDISTAELGQLCAACTGFVRFVLDSLQDTPELFGLPPPSGTLGVAPKGLVSA